MHNHDLSRGSTRLVFARHAQTELNTSKRFRGRADPPLTSEGERQARALGSSASQLAPVALYTSPRQRAVSTSMHLGAELGLMPVRLAELDDLDYGDWSGKTEQEVALTWPALHTLWRNNALCVQFPSGEAVRAAGARVAEFFDFVRCEHPDETVLAVSHDAIIRVAICVLDVALSTYHRVDVNLVSTTGILLADAPRLLWLNRETA